jgi:hypothetical protein
MYKTGLNVAIDRGYQIKLNLSYAFSGFAVSSYQVGQTQQMNNTILPL